LIAGGENKNGVRQFPMGADSRGSDIRGGSSLRGEQLCEVKTGQRLREIQSPERRKREHHHRGRQGRVCEKHFGDTGGVNHITWNT